MNMSRTNRYKARKEKITDSHDPGCSLSSMDGNDGQFLNQGDGNDVLGEFSKHLSQERASIDGSVRVLSEDVDILLESLRERWDRHQVDALLGGCRNSVLSSIVGPFGLGSVVASMDKKGGNVTTVHNAEQGVFANNRDRQRYEVEFNRKNYEKKAFIARRLEIIKSRNKVLDSYTNATLRIKNDKIELDHVISAKQLHDDKWLRMAADLKDINGIATHESNLVPTLRSINRSKNSKDLVEWMESGGNEGKINIKRFNINKIKAKSVYDDSQANYLKTKTILLTKNIGSEICFTGAQEGAKMGVQQSLGLLLTEFFSSSFDEIADAYNHGFRESLGSQSFFEALRVRLNRVVERVASRWNDAVIAFKDGAISGFLSNLVTMLINILVTTAKRIVRVIREGFFSILKAIKMVFFPPEGMTTAEAMDSGLKLLASGVTVSLGIMAEEIVEKFIATTPLAPFSQIVATVFVGAVTGISTALLVYGLDKLDIFGVNAQKKHTFLMQELDSLMASSEARINEMYDNEVERIGSFLAILQTKAG